MMAYIDFKTQSAFDEYKRLLEMSEDFDAYRRISLLLDVHACDDGKYVLTDKAIGKARKLLDRYNSGDYAKLDKDEVSLAWKELVQFKPDSTFFNRLYAISDPDYRVRFISWMSRGNLFRIMTGLNMEEVSDEIARVYNDMTQLPGIDARDVQHFFGIYYEKTSLIRMDTLNLLGNGEVEISPMYRAEGYSFDTFMTHIWSPMIVHALENYYYEKEFELIGRNVLAVTKEDTEYLVDIAQSNPNPYVRERAIECLIDNNVDWKVFLNIADLQFADTFVLSSIYLYMRDVDNKESIEWLFSKLGHSNFQERLEVQRALADHIEPAMVADVLSSKLISDDKHERADAVFMLRFIYSRARSNELWKVIDEALLKHAFDKNEDRIVRLAALQSLEYSRSKYARLAVCTLMGDADSGIRDLANGICASAASSEVKEAEVPESGNEFTSSFFRRPAQLSEIAETVAHAARLWKPGDDPVTITIVGGSYGAEAVSILLSVLEAYEASGGKWGSFDPTKNLRIITTDIDMNALIYASRSKYSREGNMVHSWYSEAAYIDNYAMGYQKDPKDYANYFVSEGEFWRLRPEYSAVIEARYLNIAEISDYAIQQLCATIVLYNQVDQYIPENQRALAASNVLGLAENYVFTNPGAIETTRYFKTQSLPWNEIGGMNVRQMTIEKKKL